ncbi:MAG: transposase [Bacteroidota bacterium]
MDLDIFLNGVSDHLHAFVALKPSMSISDLARDMKNIYLIGLWNSFTPSGFSLNLNNSYNNISPSSFHEY